MKVNILELLSYHDLRAIGRETDILSEDGLFINKRRNGVFGLYFRDAPEIAVDDFISPELYEEARGFTRDDTNDDFIFLIEILLDVFRYRKKKLVINQRLKLFCLKHIIFWEHNGNAIDRTMLFRFMLFFHPCPEDFLDRFSLNNEVCFYNGTPTDLQAQISACFDNLISNKRSFPSLANFSKEHLSVSKTLVLEVLKMMLVNTERVLYPLPEAKQSDLLNAIFSNPQQFFDVYHHEREKFLSLLEESLHMYVVKSWENDPGVQASVYYGTTANDTIERYFQRPAVVRRKKKYLSEFFVDMYVFYILRNPAGLEVLLHTYPAGHLIQQQVLTILFSHPFYNVEARLRLIESGIYKQLPEGFWKERINRMVASL